MECRSVFIAGSTAPLEYAAGILSEQGIFVTSQPQPDTGHLLLDVPSFRSGSSEESRSKLAEILPSVPEDALIWGGGLRGMVPEHRRYRDFLTDEFYLAENAAITAHCALRVGAEKLPCVLTNLPVLIIGWGRIGKCLAPLLKSAGARVTVAARRESERAMLYSLGYETATIPSTRQQLFPYRLIYNTVPEKLLEIPGHASLSGTVIVDLASVTGISGEDVISARGLPRLYAPESSGRLIAKTLLRMMEELP